MVDSNAIDPIADTPGAYEAVRAAIDDNRLELLYTHVNIDELAAISDLDRRAWLLLLLADLGRLVPTGATAVGYSRLNFCRVLDEPDAEVMEAMRSGSIKHTRDALIAATARYEESSLVTNEHRLAARARAQGIEVLTTQHLFTELGIRVGELLDSPELSS